MQSDRTFFDKRGPTKKVLYAKTSNRNEALDLTVYCHAGLFALQNIIAATVYRDLEKLANVVTEGRSPEQMAGRIRRVRHSGLP